MMMQALWSAQPGDSLVWKGVREFYNYQTARSIATLAQARELYPAHPAVHLTWAAARYMHSQAHDPVEENYRILSESLNEIIPVYRTLIHRYPDQPLYGLYLGSSVGLKARIHLGRKEWLQTLWSAYQGFRIIKRVAADNPHLVDARLPVGIVEYYASLSSFLVRWAVNLYGLEASREAGLEKIAAAADHGEYSWIEGKGILVYLYLYVEDDPEQALRHAWDLVRNFPMNWYYRQLFVECQIRTGDLPGALESLQILKSSLPGLPARQQESFRGFLYYEWGLYHFSREEYHLAHEELERAIAGFGAELDVVLSAAYVLKGQILDLEGRRPEALEYYHKAVELGNFSYAVRQAKEYQNTPFTGLN